MATAHLEINDKKVIKGDSVVDQFVDQIDCDTWNWGATQSANAHKATGSAAGRSHVNDIMITKEMDLATPNLMLACCDGTALGKVTLTCTKNTGEGPMTWLKIIMEGAIISSINFGGAPDGQGHEEVTINFAKYTLEYTAQDEDNKAAATIPVTYDIAKQLKEA